MELIKVTHIRIFLVVAALTIVCCSVSGQNAEMMRFSEIYVTSPVLQDATTKEELYTFSPVVCALHAKQYKWCHLACFTDGICSLYDLLLPSSYRENHEPAIDLNDQFKCYTNIKVNCSDGYMLQGVGCIVVVELLQTYEEAKLHCDSINARLVIPDNFEALRQNVKTTLAGDFYRVGIYNDVWMDGRTVEVWATGEPNGPNELCGSLYHALDYGLVDAPCDWKHYSICQRV